MQLAGKVKVLEVEVGIRTQMEYMSMLPFVLQSNHLVKEALTQREKAFDHRVSAYKRKFMMVALSRSEDVEVLRMFEQYEKGKKCPPELREFVSLCVYHCRAALEASLLNESYAMVSSGMGGDGTRLRYFAALSTLSKAEWSATQQHLLHEELLLAAKSHDAVVETVEYAGRFAKIVLLMPLSNYPSAVVSKAASMCNELGEFIDPREVFTNVARMPNEELEKVYEGGELQFSKMEMGG
jgi:hypothetical protein